MGSRETLVAGVSGLALLFSAVYADNNIMIDTGDDAQFAKFQRFTELKHRAAFERVKIMAGTVETSTSAAEVFSDYLIQARTAKNT